MMSSSIRFQKRNKNNVVKALPLANPVTIVGMLMPDPKALFPRFLLGINLKIPYFCLPQKGNSCLAQLVRASDC